MRILYVTEIFPDSKHRYGVWGGGERQFYELSRLAARKGHDVIVLTCRFPGQSEADFVDGVRVFRFGLDRQPTTFEINDSFRVFPYILRTAQLAKMIDPDVIHCNTYFPIFSGRMASELNGRPLVTTFHNVLSLKEWEYDQRSVFRGLVGYATTIFAAYLSGNVIIVPSKQCKAKLAGLGIDAERITVIPNGVHLAQLDATHAQRNPFQILYVGRLVHSKRIDLLVQTLQEVQIEIPKISLKIVGYGPEYPRLRRLVERLGLQDKVNFTGQTETYEAGAQCFKESALFVSPSISEGESLAVKEAMAAELPVIATNDEGSGNLSVIRDGYNGFLVEPDRSSDLRERIIELMRDEKKRKQMGAAARKSVEKCDWETIAERTIEVYKNAISQ